jgi:hypothetical protein
MCDFFTEYKNINVAYFKIDKMILFYDILRKKKYLFFSLQDKRSSRSMRKIRDVRSRDF